MSTLRKPAGSQPQKSPTAMGPAAGEAPRVGRDGEPPYVNPMQAMHEMRYGVPTTALREILQRLDVAQSVISLYAAVLRAEMAEYDSDVAAAPTHCVGDILDAQMLRIETLVEGGAS